MAAFRFLVDWYNIPFLIALGCGLLFTILQIIGGLGDHDSDVDVDVDAHADVDVDGDFFGDLLSTLGIGTVPFILVVMTVLLTFGSIGLLFNAVIRTFSATYPSWMFFVVLIATAILTVPLAGRLVRMLGSIAADSTTAIGFEQLVGRMGVVVSTSVSPSYGRVQVRDNHGSIHTVYAVSTSETIPEQSEVALLSYDSGKRCFIVKPMGRINV